MSNAKLAAIAQRLHSDNRNEREIASSKIVSITGMSLSAILRKGAVRVTDRKASLSIMQLASTLEGDDLIVAVEKEMAPIKLMWGDLVVAGCEKDMHSDSQAMFSNAFEGIFADFAKMAESAKRQTAPKTESTRPPARRIFRDDLPNTASGVPHITREGKARTGEDYVVVSFREMEGPDKSRLKPMFEFIGFGSAWTKKLKEAEANEEPVFMRFGPDRSPNKNVVIYDLV